MYKMYGFGQITLDLKDLGNLANPKFFRKNVIILKKGAHKILNQNVLGQVGGGRRGIYPRRPPPLLLRGMDEIHLYSD